MNSLEAQKARLAKKLKKQKENKKSTSTSNENPTLSSSVGAVSQQDSSSRISKPGIFISQIIWFTKLTLQTNTSILLPPVALEN